MKSHRLLGLVFTLGVFFASLAAQSNPLLGRWEPTAKGSFANNLEFTATEVVLGRRSEGNVFKAEYAIKSNEITVKSQHPVMKTFICKIESNSAMRCLLPLLGNTAYRRENAPGRGPQSGAQAPSQRAPTRAAATPREIPDISGVWEGVLESYGKPTDIRVRVTIKVGDWYNFTPQTGQKKLDGSMDTIGASTLTLAVSGRVLLTAGSVTLLEGPQYPGGSGVPYPNCQKNFELVRSADGKMLSGSWMARSTRPVGRGLASESTECPYGASGSVTLTKNGDAAGVPR